MSGGRHLVCYWVAKVRRQNIVAGARIWRGGLFLVAVLLCAASPAAPKRVRLCADIACPYSCAPGAEHPGFLVAVAQDVFNSAGYAVEYRTASWARCEEDTRAGRVEGIMGTIPAESPGFVFPQQPIAMSSDNFAVRDGDSFIYRGPGSLDGKVVGTVRGYIFLGDMGAYIARHGNDPRHLEFVSGENAMEKNLAKLAAGRIDLVLDDGNALRYEIATLGLGGKLRVTDNIRTDPVYIAFSPALGTSHQLAAILDEGIRRLRRSGRLTAIVSAYHVPAAF
jgi:polar amino acid transport system substrate-binding protein